MLDYVNDDLYLRTKYQKVYLPDIIDVPLSKLEHYTHISTVISGDKYGHIIKHNTLDNVYYLCLRYDDNIRVDSATYDIMGFRRKSKEECQKLAKVFTDAKEYDTLYGKPERTPRVLRKYLVRAVKPPILNTDISRSQRFFNKYLINVKTGKEVHLALHMAGIIRETGLKNNIQVDTVVNCGYILSDWCYKGERLDGKTWDQYFSELA
jgi:hypothetical protein